MTPVAQRGALVTAFRASGLTQAAFARREGLNAKTLSHWLKPGACAVAPPTAVRFARLSLPSAAAVSPTTLEVGLADGTIVRGGDARAVVEVVRALRG
jgi:hypothetical protein